MAVSCLDLPDEAHCRREIFVSKSDARAAEPFKELRRSAGGEAFDEQPMPGLDSEALDFRAASESFVIPDGEGEYDTQRIGEASDQTLTHRRGGKDAEIMLETNQSSLRSSRLCGAQKKLDLLTTSFSVQGF